MRSYLGRKGSVTQLPRGHNRAKWCLPGCNSAQGAIGIWGCTSRTREETAEIFFTEGSKVPSVALDVFFAVYPAMVVPKRKKYFFSIFVTFFCFRTENRKQKTHLGFHMRQPASKSVRTASEERPAKSGSPFGPPLGDGPKSRDFGSVYVRAIPTGDFECLF